MHPPLKYPIYVPFVAKNQKKYVMDCLDSNWISSQGQYIKRFETSLAKFLKVKQAIVVFNGSVSLMLILKALDIGYGDEVIVPSLTYIATISSINLLGATAALVDSDDNFQMQIKNINKLIGKKTKAIMVPELYGDAPDINKLVNLCNNHSIYLIEDSAEAFGCSVGDKMIGSFGIASSFSFFGNKSITCGEGGTVCTNDEALAERMRLLKNQAHMGDFKHAGPGFNFRMTNIQAAIGLAQLEDIDMINSRKKEIASYYRANLKVKAILPNINSSEWMPLFMLPDDVNYYKFREDLLDNGIDSRHAFTPVHLMTGFKTKIKGKLKNSEKIYKQGFNLPCYPDLTNDDIKYIVEKVNLLV